MELQNIYTKETFTILSETDDYYLVRDIVPKADQPYILPKTRRITKNRINKDMIFI